ncbi:ycfA domain-containing protein [Rutstroemia sp. NJR-2017a BVV2]|nr:ycfA domain-containing protein [Rutstroemia sp. NJR-2017a BVV2]
MCINLSDSDARGIITELAIHIMGSYVDFVKLISQVGRKVEAVWRKKTREKRAKFLKDLDMCICDTVHYESYHFKIWNEPDRMTSDESKAFRAAMLSPFLNIEHLKFDPNTLISMLKGRAEYSPAQWALFDRASSEDAFQYENLCSLFSHRSWISMRNESYGKVVEWEPRAAHSAEILSFGRGFLVLQGQIRVYAILIQIIKGLAGGFHGEVNPKLSLVVNPPTRPSARFARGVARPVFDINKLAEDAQTTAALANDHLSELQTNLDYVQKYFVTLKTDLTKAEAPVKHMDVILLHEELEDDKRSALLWDALSIQVGELQILHSRRSTKSASSHEAFLKKLRKCELFLLEMRDLLTESFGTKMYHRPGFKHAATRKAAPGGYLAVKPHGTIGDSYWNDPLHFRMCWIAGAQPNTKNPAYPTFLRRFEYLNNYLEQASIEERARVDENLEKKLSELGMINELLMNIGMQHPFHEPLDVGELLETEPGAGWEYLRILKEPKGDFKSSGGYDFEQIKDSLITIMELPLLTGKRDHAWHKGRLIARSALAKYWEAMRKGDGECLTKCGMTTTAVQREILRISADKHPDHLAMLEEERNAMKSFVERNPHTSEKAAQDLLRSLSLDESKQKLQKTTSKRAKKNKARKGGPVKEALIDEDIIIKDKIEISTNDNSQTNEIKTVKVLDISGTLRVEEVRTLTTDTRPGTGAHDNSLHDLLLPPTPPTFKGKEAEKPSDLEPPVELTSKDPLRTIPVSKRSLETFEAMLSTSKIDRKNLKWDGFCAAMAEVGFESKGSSGSVVRFEPKEDSQRVGLGSINFHRPHPDPTKIDPITVAWMGKRMKKWFGWVEELFQLKT